MFEHIPPFVLTILAGILGATAWNVLGFYEKHGETGPWDPRKYEKTLVTGVIGGALLAVFLDLSPEATFFTAFCTDVSRGMLRDIFRKGPE